MGTGKHQFFCLYELYGVVYAARNGSHFFHRTKIFDFVVRWDKKVYRRHCGKYVEDFRVRWIWICLKYFMDTALLVMFQIV